jgi:hypothetical protein
MGWAIDAGAASAGTGCSQGTEWGGEGRGGSERENKENKGNKVRVRQGILRLYNGESMSRWERERRPGRLGLKDASFVPVI